MHTTFEICTWIRKAVMTAAAEVICYTSWDADFCAKNVRELPDRLKKAEGFRLIDPSDLTEQEMKDLGFGRWSEDNPIRLIPLWLFPFLADEFVSGSIDGETPTLTKKSNMDDDHRGGNLAYGVLPRA